MQIRQPRNEGVVRYLERNSKAIPDLRLPRERHLDYMECGAHPDVVERVWDELGKHLPLQCRQVVLGTPGLIAPQSGVVLALAFGTQYTLRLPGRVVREGAGSSVRTVTTWSTGGQMNIHEEFGPDWIFGSWGSAEEAWCLEAFREAENE